MKLKLNNPWIWRQCVPCNVRNQ